MNVGINRLKRLCRNRSALVGATILGLFILTAIFAPSIATHDPLKSMIGTETGPLPGKAPCIPIFGCEDSLHIMGLDLNGRDVFSRLVFGARVTLLAGTTSVFIALIIGGLIGLFSGYVGKWTDNILMRIMDVMLAFPQLLLAIAFVAVRGPGLQNAILAISLALIPIFARLTRVSVLATKQMEFITATRAIGAGPLRTMFMHIVPHAINPLIVQATLGVGTAILDVAALSFLGLGAQPPTPEWGQMLSEGRACMFTAPHIVFFPGVAITLVVLAINLFGDGLRDALDPRLNRI